MSKLVFGYWSVRGYAGPIRNLLHYAGVEYEEKLYDSTTQMLADNVWTREKFTLGFDLPNVPYWIEKETGVKLTESKAILRHIAREYAPDLFPKTNAEARQADMMESFVVTLQERVIVVAYYYSDEASVQMEQFVKDKFGYLTKYLNGKKWILGQKLSYVDFLAYEMLFFHKTYNPTILDNFPELVAYMKAFETLPAIAKYTASKEYIKGPCLGPLATIKF